VEGDINRSHESVPSRANDRPVKANVCTRASGTAWAEDERVSLCAWRGGERSPKDGRTFSSSMCLAQLRRFR
jgi:hypothetical protein